mgnify:FL=1
MKNSGEKKSRRANVSKSYRQSFDKVWLFGFHAVEAALKNENRKLYRLLATKNSLNKLGNIAALKNLPITITKPNEYSKYIDENSVHQGLALEAKPLDWGSIKDLNINQYSKGPIIVLDRVKDPQNVGAIIRSMEVLGGSAVIGSKHHCAHETGSLVKAASGAFERIPYITVPNISRSIESLIENEYVIVGLDHSGTTILVDLLKSLKKQPIAFILGSEGSGLRDLTKKKCNHLVQINTENKFGILNVSNAAAVTLFAAREFLK